MPRSSICCAVPCRSRAASARLTNRLARPRSEHVMSANEELAALQREWKPPSELRAMGPREVRLKAGGVALVCLATLLLIGAIVGATALSRVRAREASQNAVLRAAGAEVKATVTRHWRGGDKSET